MENKNDKKNAQLNNPTAQPSTKNKTFRKKTKRTKLVEKCDKVKTTIKENNPDCKVRFFNSPESERRYDLFMKHNFINYRENKDADYSKIRTTDYKSYEEMLKDNASGDYVQNSLDACTRCSIIIDCDLNDKGESTRKILEEFGIVWQYCKVREKNGHSQTAIDIEPYTIKNKYLGDISTTAEQVAEKEITCNRKYLTVSYLFNMMANGDLGFTGSNCQNPYCTKYGHTIWNKEKKTYTVDELYDRLLEYFDFFETQSDIDSYISDRRKEGNAIKALTKKAEETKKPGTKVFYWSKLLSPQEYAEKMGEVYDEEGIKELTEQELEGSNNTLYRVTNEHFAYMIRHGYKPTLNSLTRHVKKLLKQQVIKLSYNPVELETRIASTFKSVSRTFDIEKAGYTEAQRKLSQSIRSAKQFSNYLAVQKYKKDLKKGIKTVTEVAKKLGVSRTTVYKYLTFNIEEIDLEMLGYSLRNANSKDYIDAYEHLYKTAYRKIQSIRSRRERAKRYKTNCKGRETIRNTVTKWTLDQSVRNGKGGIVLPDYGDYLSRCWYQDNKGTIESYE